MLAPRRGHSLLPRTAFSNHVSGHTQEYYSHRMDDFSAWRTRRGGAIIAARSGGRTMKKVGKIKHNRTFMDRRGFLQTSASSVLLASVAAGSIRDPAGARASRAPGPEIFFTKDEYLARWGRVQAAMAAAGHENLLVWQRSAGT